MKQLSLPGGGLRQTRKRWLHRIAHKSVSSLILQALDLSPFRDAPSERSLPLETLRLFKSFFDKSLGSSAKICRTGRLFAVRFVRNGEESAVTRQTVSAQQVKYIIKNHFYPKRPVTWGH